MGKEKRSERGSRRGRERKLIGKMRWGVKMRRQSTRRQKQTEIEMGDEKSQEKCKRQSKALKKKKNLLNSHHYVEMGPFSSFSK